MKEHNLMSSFEINKIMGSIFSVILLLLVIKNLGNILYIEEDITLHSKNIEGHINIVHKEEQINVNSENIIISIEERLKNADINAGKLSAKKCIACHSFEKNGPNKIGPNLNNIYLRQIASIKNFQSIIDDFESDRKLKTEKFATQVIGICIVVMLTLIVRVTF